jgi:hypothetical protein
MQYQEGDIIKLSFLKEISINDADRFYLFQHEAGDRFMLEKTMYSLYSFQSGKTINARIDRINCSGKIFIEPEHPVYKDLQIYKFDVLKIVSKTEADIIVKDCFSNIIPVKVHPSKKDKKEILLTVAFLRKGIPLLFDPDLDQNFKYEERKIYPFTIDRFQKDTNGDSEIVLVDKEGILQFLPANFYHHYNLKTGQTIKCEVVRINYGRRLSLEPLHPFLKKGEIKELKYVSPLSPDEAKLHKHKLHKLSDSDENLFLLSDRFVTENLKKGMHQYQIDAFKKGQVYVEPV